MYDELRQLPLLDVIRALGFANEFKTRKGGTEYYGACIIHGSKKNQTCFSFNADGKFNCFSCGQKGRGAIDLVKAVKGCSFQEAVDYLKTTTSVTTGNERTGEHPEPPATETTEEHTENPIYKSSYEKFKVESEWLKNRGFTDETLKHFGVFQYENPKRKSAYNGSILIPIRRFRDGEVVGYLARTLRDEGPKYVWPKGVLKSLEVFGSWQLRSSQSPLPLRFAFLVESPFAVMKFHQLGFPAVSCYGWSVAPQQVELLSQIARGWVFLPDKDKRAEALSQVLPSLSQRGWMKCPEYPTDDPEHLTKEQIQALI